VAEPVTTVPLPVRLELARAAIQTIAAQQGARVLHIKGATVDESLRPVVAAGTDVDVLVVPDDLARLDAALREHGWSVYSTFRNGSPFEHAQTYWHPDWGYADVHRWFPGIRMPAARAFDLLAAGGGVADAAGVGCPVPSVDAQAVVLMLNAARGTPRARAIANTVWDAADDRTRHRREALVDALDARTAWCATRGTLDSCRGRRDYALWNVTVHGGTRTAEWWARVRAQPRLRDAVITALRAPLVNTDRLRHELGRAPRAGDLLRAFGRRARRAWLELTGRRR
jgi:hypothetical protein